LCLNVDKTNAIWIGSIKGSNALLCPDLNLTWENETFNFLGVTFSINLADMIILNKLNTLKAFSNAILNVS